MPPKQFEKLRNQIEKLVEKLEQEALAEGVDILSDEFQKTAEEFKRNILAEKGISLEDFEKFEEESGLKVDLDQLSEFFSKAKQLSETKFQGFKSEIDSIIEKLKEEQEKSKTEIIDQIQNLDKKKPDREEVRELEVSMEKELSSVQKKVKGEIDLLEKKRGRDREEGKRDSQSFDKKIKEHTHSPQSLEHTHTELHPEKHLLESHIRLKATTEQLNRLIGGDNADDLHGHFFPQPKTIIGGGGGHLITVRDEGTNITLQADILDFVGAGVSVAQSGLITTVTIAGGGGTANEENPTGTIDGTNAVFTLSATPLANTLALYLNGIFQTPGGVDYTLSSDTITYVVAPPTGSAHRAKFNT